MPATELANGVVDDAKLPLGGRKPTDLDNSVVGQLSKSKPPKLNRGSNEDSKVDKPKDKDGSLKIKIELDLEVEIHLSARIKGDITIGLL